MQKLTAALIELTDEQKENNLMDDYEDMTSVCIFLVAFADGDMPDDIREDDDFIINLNNALSKYGIINKYNLEIDNLMESTFSIWAKQSDLKDSVIVDEICEVMTKENIPFVRNTWFVDDFS